MQFVIEWHTLSQEVKIKKNSMMRKKDYPILKDSPFYTNRNRKKSSSNTKKYYYKLVVFY